VGIVYPLVLFPLALIATCFVLKMNNISSYSWLFLFFYLLPGVLGLWWARRYKIKILFLPRNRYFWISLLGGFLIGALAFFVNLWFSEEAIQIVGIKKAIIYLFYYILFLFLLFMFFIGGEICWRGYLWERWKNYPIRREIAIWLLWSLWSVPMSMTSSEILFGVILNNLSLMPILHFFREKSQSIGPGTLFYASLNATLLCFHMFFSYFENCHLIIQDVLLLLASGMFVFFRWKGIKFNLLGGTPN